MGFEVRRGKLEEEGVAIVSSFAWRGWSTFWKVDAACRVQELCGLISLEGPEYKVTSRRTSANLPCVIIVDQPSVWLL